MPHPTFDFRVNLTTIYILIFWTQIFYFVAYMFFALQLNMCNFEEIIIYFTTNNYLNGQFYE